MIFWFETYHLHQKEKSCSRKGYGIFFGPA